MSDTVMLMLWMAALGAVIVAGRRGNRRDSDLEKLRDWVTAQNVTHQKKVEARLAQNEADVDRSIGTQMQGLSDLLRDLNLRVARAEATIAATPTPPDPATIIAAATAPLLALTEQYTSSPQFIPPQVAQPTAGDGEWTAEELAAYDPTDEDFPPYRAADDYSPPAGFAGLGVELPRLDG